MTDRELMQQVLDALEDYEPNEAAKAIETLRARLAQPEPSVGPVAWSVFNTGAEVASGLSFDDALDYLTPERLERGWSAVCVVDKSNLPNTAPPQREWQSLTDEEVDEAISEANSMGLKSAFRDLVARAIEAKLRKKNG